MREPIIIDNAVTTPTRHREPKSEWVGPFRWGVLWNTSWDEKRSMGGSSSIFWCFGLVKALWILLLFRTPRDVSSRFEISCEVTIEQPAKQRGLLVVTSVEPKWAFWLENIFPFEFSEFNVNLTSISLRITSYNVWMRWRRERQLSLNSSQMHTIFFFKRWKEGFEGSLLRTNNFIASIFILNK